MRDAGDRLPALALPPRFAGTHERKDTMNTEDGEPFDNAVTVERLQDGKWVETARYEAGS